MNRNPNYQGQFGGYYNANAGYSGFQQRGRGRGDQNPRFHRGQGPRGFQNRGGNFDRPWRGRGGQQRGQNFSHQPFNARDNNPYAWKNKSNLAQSENTIRQTEHKPPEDEFEQHHFAYEYEEESASQDAQTTSYEQVPEYKQSDATADNYTENNPAESYGDDGSKDDYADDNTADDYAEDNTADDYADDNTVDDYVDDNTADDYVDNSTADDYVDPSAEEEKALSESSYVNPYAGDPSGNGYEITNNLQIRGVIRRAQLCMQT